MKITNKMRSKLFRIAHAIRNKFENFGQALAKAWRVMRIVLKMKNDYVEFTYKKVDGSIRKAVGTLNFEYESKGGKNSPLDSLVYFDKEKNSIRSCKIYEII